MENLPDPLYTSSVVVSGGGEAGLFLDATKSMMILSFKEVEGRVVEVESNADHSPRCRPYSNAVRGFRVHWFCLNLTGCRGR